MRAARRFCRSLVLGAAFATAGAGTALGQGAISLLPGFPAPGDPIVVSVSAADGNRLCAIWRIGARSPRTVRLEGTTVPPEACAPSPPPVHLAPLPAGHYTITAHLDGAAEPFAEARFDVSASPPAASVEFDVALSPPTPRAGAPFALTFTATQDIFDGILFSGEPPIVVGDLVVIAGELSSCNVTCPRQLQTTGWRHAMAGLSAGDKSVEVRDRDRVVARFGFHVDADTTLLPLAGGRFEASLHWTDRAGAGHDATAVRLTEESGQFWFFDPSNPEVTVKLVDGTGFNHHWWVFVSSMTDLGFTLTVRNAACAVASCVPERRYTQEARHNRNFIDTSAFPVCTGTCPP